jgi:hypothetical protein
MGRSLRQAGYLTAGMGMVHAALFLVSFWIVRSIPKPRSVLSKYS